MIAAFIISSQTTKRGEIIYADLGSVPLHNKPAIPPPPIDRVIYSDAREFKPKVSILPALVAQ